MIPVSLHLTNFLSYKEMPAPLSFEGITLACLTGPNGHGKSSLLDAITWAVWGRARGAEGGHEQERLIHDGAESARVEFCFALDGQRYRIVRERSRSGRASLEFAVAAPDGGWTDLGGEGIRETQERIERHMRMDYDTFVASAFIVQGRADTFTKLDPADRKQVLGRILGIEIYERFAERARERKRECTAEAGAVETVIEGLDRELEALPGVRADAERAAADAAISAEAVAAATAAHEAAAAEAARLEAAERTAAEIRTRAQAAASRVRDTEAEITELDRRIVTLGAEAVVAPALAEQAAARDTRRAALEALEVARRRHEELTAEVRDLAGRIEAERARLVAERDQAAKRLAECDAEAAAGPEQAARLERARAQEAEVVAAAERMEALAAEAAAKGERRAALKAEKSRRERDVAEIEEKVQLLSGAEAACPLCGDALTPEHRDEILRDFADRRRTLLSEDATAGAEYKALANRDAEIRVEVAALRKLVADRNAVAAAVAQATEALVRVEAARSTAAQLRETIGRLDQALSREDYAPTERAKLASVRAEITAAGYDPAAYDAARIALDAAQDAADAVARAAQAAARLEETRTARSAAAERLASFAGELRDAEAAVSGAEAAAAGLPAARKALAGAAASLAAARERETDARTRVATLAQSIERLEALGIQAAEARAKAADAKRRARLYEKIAKAFGRDGIPARIIGNAVPELQREANELLNLLSDGQLTISIESVRRTKSGRDKESLDITVYDGGERRPYDMYSGGERLRIDFALRVALSRLLVYRAGARLETLVVDEGFGSQDAEGRARLVEAIHRVKDSFALILVMTHLEDVKEQFPVRIEVSKDAQRGSVIRVA